MEGFTEKKVRSVLGQYYDNHHGRGKTFTVKHFCEMGMPRSIIYSVSKRFDDGGNPERKSGSGRKAIKLSPA